MEQQIALLRGCAFARICPSARRSVFDVASGRGSSGTLRTGGRDAHPTREQASPTPEAPPAKVEPKPFGPYRPIEKSATAGFTERQQQHLNALLERYVQKTAESKRRTQQTRRHFADPRSVSGFRTFWKEMVYPIITVRSAGATILGHRWQ